jgi:segregation and condensation protein A
VNDSLSNEASTIDNQESVLEKSRKKTQDEETKEKPGKAQEGNSAETPKPKQEEMPFAYVQGTPVTELPQDLYIPPEALEVFLEAFEGPLDLLLYLIKRQNIDILDIPIAEITEQYVSYVEMMQDFQFELAAEYLVMAAMLAEIKSRMLLPRPESVEEDEADPRAELIRRLQEYERFKKAAMDLDDLPRMGRDVFAVSSEIDYSTPAQEPDVSMQELMLALREVMQRAEMFTHHNIEREALSVRERMSIVLERLSQEGFTRFTSLFHYEEGKSGVVVTFLAILELSKQRMLEIVQTETYGPIHVKPLSGSALETGDVGTVLSSMDNSSFDSE